MIFKVKVVDIIVQYLRIIFKSSNFKNTEVFDSISFVQYINFFGRLLRDLHKTKNQSKIQILEIYLLTNILKMQRFVVNPSGKKPIYVLSDLHEIKIKEVAVLIKESYVYIFEEAGFWFKYIRCKIPTSGRFSR